jgi:peptidoglycan-N-acetylglucosamine deacetylase
MRFVTFSWDDGCQEDLKMADLFAKEGLKCSFYVPARNAERKTISASEIRSIGSYHDIGGHTYSHAILTKISLAEARNQIFQGKSYLEDIIGHEIDGFCYPRGKWNYQIHAAVLDIGFRYVRMVDMFQGQLMNGQFLRTSLQLYPHSMRTYILHLLKRRNWAGFAMLYQLKNSATLKARIDQIARYAGNRERSLHFWGHSWEVEDLNLWNEIRQIIITLKENNWLFLSNSDYVRHVESFK